MAKADVPIENLMNNYWGILLCDRKGEIIIQFIEWMNIGVVSVGVMEWRDSVETL